MHTGEGLKNLNTTRKSILSYGVYGFILGFIFPLLGILYELLHSGNRTSFIALQKIHEEQPFYFEALIMNSPFAVVQLDVGHCISATGQ
jgi:hypothetical protein